MLPAGAFRARMRATISDIWSLFLTLLPAPSSILRPGSLDGCGRSGGCLGGSFDMLTSAGCGYPNCYPECFSDQRSASQCPYFSMVSPMGVEPMTP